MADQGKYRGKVVNNNDPLMLGRIIGLVPAISEKPLTWATPCVPYAGAGVGFFAVPPIDANVWIEFEGGDPGKPIWTGCFWGKDEVPAEPAVPTTKVFKTDRITVSVDDLASELKLEVETDAGLRTVVMGPDGIKLSSDAVTVTIAQEAIELKNAEASVSVASQAVAVKNGSATAEIAPQSVALKNGDAGVEIMPGSIGLRNGGASVDLSPASVSLNKGALEVM
ncbi:MAG: baseplate assembly protein [Anaerolineae bacterium]|nr:MAG: baseplate assembly protein [Anaerolineae bacterium]